MSKLIGETTTELSQQFMFAPNGVLQRKCDCGQHTMAGGKCEACSKKRGDVLHRKAADSSEMNEAPPIVREVLNSPGQPLDAETRALFEPRFGRDFSNVRVHTDAKAAESAQAVNAQAYTVGRDIVFGTGQYVPEIAAGKRLLAHELTHVVQQGFVPGADHKGDRNAALSIGASDGVFEAEAQRMAKMPLASKSLSGRVYESIMQRQPLTAGQSETVEARLRRQATTTIGVLSSIVVSADARGDAGVTITIRNTGEELVPGFVSHAEPHHRRPSGMTHATEGIIAAELRPILDMIILSGAGEWRVTFGRTTGGQMRLQRTEAVPSSRPARETGPIELEPVEIRGIVCACDPATERYYDAETVGFISSIEPLITSIAGRGGLPTAPVAGAIADEYDTRRGVKGVVDAIQDSVIDALPEFSIDIDRFFDIHAKLLNTLENDVGPANIKVRTALELVQQGELTVPGSPPSDIQVNRIVDFLLTERGTVEATTAVIARAQRLFGPHLTEHGEELREAVLVEYFKQGDSYFDRFSRAVAANPAHKICPGDGGCRFWHNRDRIQTVLHSGP